MVKNIKNGLYSYKFNGFSAKKTLHFHIAGIGIMRLIDGSITEGFHSASSIQLKDTAELIRNAEFTLTGYCSVSNKFHDLMWLANVKFVQVSPQDSDKQILVGTFTLCPSGEDKYSIISTGARREDPGHEGEAANEVVSGEIVWIGD